MTGKKNALLFIGFQTDEWAEAALSLAGEYKSRGYEVKALDISRFTYPRRISSLEGKKGFDSLLFQKAPRAADSGMLADGIEDEILREAADGALKSFRRDDSPSPSFINSLIRSHMVFLGKNLKSAVTSILMQQPVDIVIVPNGRFVHERAVLLAASEYKIDTVSYELGSLPGCYVVENYSPHSRDALQKDFLSQNLKLSPTVSSTVLSWLQSRDQVSGTNAFAKLWSSENAIQVSKFKNAFFTSSTDEIGALGADWKIDSWVDQYEAFDRILYFLEETEKSETSILRVHPNLLNKSPAMYNREIKKIEWLSSRHGNLKIIWHTDPQNSYEIIKQSARVIVSLSSIGVEATLLNKPVWVTHASHYDDVIGVKKIFSPEDLTVKNLSLYDADFDNAKLFSFFLLKRNKRITVAPVRNSGFIRVRKVLVALLANANPFGIIALAIQFHLSFFAFHRQFVARFKNAYRSSFGANT